MKNEYANPTYKATIAKLKKELLKQKQACGDTEDEKMPEMQEIMKKCFW
jgi:hypothetical protein